MEFSQLLCLLLLHTSPPVQRGTSVCFLPYQADIYICEENTTSSAKNLYLIVVIKHYFLSSKHIRQHQLLQMTHSNRPSNAGLGGAFELAPLQRCAKTWSKIAKLPGSKLWHLFFWVMRQRKAVSSWKGTKRWREPLARWIPECETEKCSRLKLIK